MKRKPAKPAPPINASAEAEIAYKKWLRSFLKPRGWKPKRLPR